MIKEIIKNRSNLKLNDINRTTRRAKVLVINQNKLLLAHAAGDYFFIGGHIEKNETDEECLKREIKEECGTNFEIPLKKFMQIKHFEKDYPKKDINTLSITNYYIYEGNIKINFNRTNLTEEEKENNFELVYLDKNEVIKILNESLKTGTRIGATIDTLEVIKEYMRIYESINNKRTMG